MSSLNSDEMLYYRALGAARVKISDHIVASVKYTPVQKGALMAELKDMHDAVRGALVESGVPAASQTLERWRGQVLGRDFFEGIAKALKHALAHPKPANQRLVRPRGERCYVKEWNSLPPFEKWGYDTWTSNHCVKGQGNEHCISYAH